MGQGTKEPIWSVGKLKRSTADEMVVCSDFIMNLNCTDSHVNLKYANFIVNLKYGNFIVNLKYSRSFENSYIPENPRTPKPLTFSKNRLRGAKNRSNLRLVAKKNFRKNNFFFSKSLHICKKNSCICACFKILSLYTTYLKGFVKKNLKKNAKKKSCIYAKIKKKSCIYAKVEKKYRFFGNFFQRILFILNVLEGSEVGFLKGITIYRDGSLTGQIDIDPYPTFSIKWLNDTETDPYQDLIFNLFKIINNTDHKSLSISSFQPLCFLPNPVPKMNDADVSKQIQQMVRFIRQEAEEKANEISVSAEEEFNIEKLQLVEAEKKKIRQEYERKQKQVEVRKKIEYSMQLNASRIKVLQAQDDLVSAMRDVASKDLLNVSHHHFHHKHNYEALLKGLIVQGLLRLKEPSVLLRCRKEDLHKVESVIHSAKEEYASKSHVHKPEIIVDRVVLASRDGKIVYENTLDARLDVVFRGKLPEIRKLLLKGHDVIELLFDVECDLGQVFGTTSRRHLNESKVLELKLTD
ncbi:hypothetical protein LXL04_005798 [Taraxacum kok-saghyz]